MMRSRWKNSSGSRVDGDGHLGFVTGPEGIDHRSGGKDLYRVYFGEVDPIVVISVRGPAKEKPVREKIGLVAVQDEGPGREAADRFRERDFGATPVDPLLVQHFVDLPDRGFFIVTIAGIGFQPKVLETVEGFAA